MERSDLGQDPSSEAFWRQRWEEGRTAWDQGGEHPKLIRLLREARTYGFEPGSRIWEPGCGRAHNGAALAKAGFDVVGLDRVGQALDQARRLYDDVEGLSLVQGDACRIEPDWRDFYDAVFDRAMLCALPKESRMPYVQACFHHLRPGGFFLSFPFTKLRNPHHLGPPFPLTLQEQLELLAPYFSLLSSEEWEVEDTDHVAAREMMCVWKKREHDLDEGEQQSAKS